MSDAGTVFAITAITLVEGKEGPAHTTRLVVVCGTFPRAVEYVTTNELDWVEGTADYAVIEELLLGAPQTVPGSEVVWYHVNRDADGEPKDFQRLDKAPEGFKSLTHFWGG
jgi:hypothetical protein